MDVVYVVGPDPVNEELRYSLRSLTNLPHDKVWIAGAKPRFVRNVGHLDVKQNRTSKYQNVIANIWAACNDKHVSDYFTLFNDDFYVLEPVDRIPKLHRGTIADHLAQYPGRSSAYLRGLVATDELCTKAGHHGTHYSYALHVPFVVNRHLLRGILEWLHTERPPDAVHIRTLYGNMLGPLGDLAHDCKVTGLSPAALHDILATDRGGPFLSTYDGSFEKGEVGRYLRRLFPNPSPYEAGNPPTP